MGMDWYWVHECTFCQPLRYSDFNIGDQVRTDEPAIREQQDWLGTDKETLNKTIAAQCDAIVAGLYEYHVCYKPHFPDKVHYIPLPIKPQENCVATTNGNKLRVFIGISKGRSEYKGTDIMLRAAESVAAKYPDKIEIIKAEGVPFALYEKLMNGSDAILDQLYAYSPSMNPLLAMSKGIICIGGGEPEIYEILNEDKLRPIINVEPNYDSVYQALEQLVLHPESISKLKRQSIEFVERYHDYLKIARQYEALYAQL